VVVSATKSEREVLLTPVRISSVPIQSIRSAPLLSSEDIIKGVSGLVVSRTLGIFDKNASVTARGLGKEQARTLIMIDGIPINKASTGSANFSMINTALIDRVEVVKGPNSNIFGGNAMGGSVNFITREPSEGFRSFIQTDYGSFNTVGTKVSATYSDKGFFAGASAFARKSDGYNPYDDTDSSTIAATLSEKSAGAFAGYRFGGNNVLKAEFNITDALRGKGERLYTGSGVVDGTNHYTNRNYRLSYSGKSGASDWNLTAFLSTENYSEIKWKGSDIFDVIVDRKDYGVWASYSYTGVKNHSIGAGIEYKGGFVDGADDYRTSTDVVINRGKSNGFSLYVLDEISLMGGRITIVKCI
jgi:outer membrane receptor protein involved in Fe transport